MSVGPSLLQWARQALLTFVAGSRAPTARHPPPRLTTLSSLASSPLPLHPLGIARHSTDRQLRSILNERASIYTPRLGTSQSPSAPFSAPFFFFFFLIGLHVVCIFLSFHPTNDGSPYVVIDCARRRSNHACNLSVGIRRLDALAGVKPLNSHHECHELKLASTAQQRLHCCGRFANRLTTHSHNAFAARVAADCLPFQVLYRHPCILTAPSPVPWPWFPRCPHHSLSAIATTAAGKEKKKEKRKTAPILTPFSPPPSPLLNIPPTMHCIHTAGSAQPPAHPICTSE
ncbi:hypothetical protein IWX90DRAFT_165506 [Phyllosticta citrichinensis]|uniref:Uncharacterized protein n=1 Tax=Phyllosticta citrichinensis TaxID=1130410 RepID=A0ABR1Y0M7_9PEZI